MAAAAGAGWGPAAAMVLGPAVGSLVVAASGVADAGAASEAAASFELAF